MEKTYSLICRTIVTSRVLTEKSSNRRKKRMEARTKYKKRVHVLHYFTIS